ncbi:MAG: CoA transferase [Burkholderiales bacterium]|nr:MAG: CoA transferase [Burkholderiales bacterium]
MEQVGGNASGSSSGAWLGGLRVVELGQFLSAPFGGMIFCDLGAEVVKVEVPGKGDDGRRMGMPFEGGDALIFRDLNRGKKSVTIDIKSDDGRQSLMALLETADIVISNLRQGVLAALGLDGPALSARFPRLVCCDLSAFGHAGPMHHDPGYEPLAQAYSGLASVNGTTEGPPLRTGPSIVDLGSGMWIVIAALAALRQRDANGGRGGVVELSLLETAMTWIGADVSGYLNEGRVPARRGNAQPLLVPYDAFSASDGMICLAVGNDTQFARLAEVVGFPEWAADARFATNGERIRNRATLTGMVAALLMTRSRDHWEASFRSAGIPCTRFNTIAEAVASPQVASLGMLRPSPSTGRQSLGLPFTIDGVRPGSLDEAPALGEHNSQYL